MAFSGNNQTIYNAALDGALAGMVASGQVQDPTTADYAALGAAATVWATKLDSLIATDATLSTGAGGTTIAPIAGATTANLNAKGHLAFALSFGFWFGRNVPLSAPVTAAAVTAGATAVAAVYAQGVAQYALAPGGSSLT